MSTITFILTHLLAIFIFILAVAIFVGGCVRIWFVDNQRLEELVREAKNLKKGKSSGIIPLTTCLEVTERKGHPRQLKVKKKVAYSNFYFLD